MAEKGAGGLDAAAKMYGYTNRPVDDEGPGGADGICLVDIIRLLLQSYTVLYCLELSIKQPDRPADDQAPGGADGIF
jgi:hypothetical protein